MFSRYYRVAKLVARKDVTKSDNELIDCLIYLWSIHFFSGFFRSQKKVDIDRDSLPYLALSLFTVACGMQNQLLFVTSPINP